MAQIWWLRKVWIGMEIYIHYMPSFCYFTKLKTHNYAGAVFGQSPALACKLAVAVASAQPH